MRLGCEYGFSCHPKNRGRTRRHKVTKEEKLVSSWLCECIILEIWENTIFRPKTRSLKGTK